MNLGHDFLDVLCGGISLREQDGHQEPARDSPGSGNVIGINLDGIPADLLGDKGDRVRFKDQTVVSKGQDGTV